MLETALALNIVQILEEYSSGQISLELMISYNKRDVPCPCPFCKGKIAHTWDTSTLENSVKADLTLAPVSEYFWTPWTLESPVQSSKGMWTPVHWPCCFIEPRQGDWTPCTCTRTYAHACARVQLFHSWSLQAQRKYFNHSWSLSSAMEEYDDVCEYLENKIYPEGL